MDKQETKKDFQANLEDFVIGKFADRQEAENAAQVLKEGSFPGEQIQIERLTLKHLLNLPQSKKVKRGKEGAIVGAALGITIGLSISLIIESLPDAQISINLSPLLIVILSGVLGAFA